MVLPFIQLVSISAAELVKMPIPTKRPITAPDVDKARVFRQVAGQHRLAALFSVALACPLRLGEATGLAFAGAFRKAAVRATPDPARSSV